MAMCRNCGYGLSNHRLDGWCFSCAKAFAKGILFAALLLAVGLAYTVVVARGTQ